MTKPHIDASPFRCRRCGVDASSADAPIVDRIAFQDEDGPGELLFRFCEPCFTGFGDEVSRLAYVRGLLAC